MSSFWNTLKKPYLVLAPMADVTDSAFRALFARYGKPDVIWTEFVSADGLYHTRERGGRPDTDNPLMKDLHYSDAERPIVAQLFTAKPDMLEYAVKCVVDLGFDGVDINMGCPDRAVERQGAGAALIRDPGHARTLIQAAKKGAGGAIPVSVKTRVGYHSATLVPWLGELLSEEPALITVHARTRKDLSLVPARWEYVAEAVSLRDKMGVATHIVGNGDIASRTEAYARARETGADGVMIGRGVFGNPWFFSDHIPTLKEKLSVLSEHCTLFESLCSHKPFSVMKKHVKAYVNGFEGAAELRATLMACDTGDAMRAVLAHRLQTANDAVYCTHE